MLSKIAGVFWIILGIIWTAKPHMLKNYLSRKVTRKMKRVVYFFLIVFGVSLLGSVFRAPGVLYKIIGIIGLIATIKGIMLITSKASEKMFAWLGERPVVYFRVLGLVILGIGIALIFV